MILFSVIFGGLAKLPSEGIPYPIFTFTALLPWQLFAFALTQSSNSLVGDQKLVSKVYFPRLVVPFSSVMAGVVDFAIAFVVLVGMMAFYGIKLTAAALLLPVFLALAVASAAGDRTVAVGIKCQVPGYPLRGAVPDAVLDVCDTDRIFKFADPGKVALAVQPEPDDGGGGGVPLGDPGEEQPGPDLAGDLSAGSGSAAGGRTVLFQADGKQLRGRHLMSDLAIRVEHLGKGIPAGRAAGAVCDVPRGGWWRQPRHRCAG